MATGIRQAAVRLLISIKSYMEIDVLVVVAMLSWLLVRRVDAVILMRYIYPLLVALHVLAVLILLWRYLFVLAIRSPLIRPVIIYIAVQGLGYFLLALATAPQPLIVFSESRWLIVWARLLSAGSISVVAGVGLFHFIRELRHADDHADPPPDAG
jgi:hypothetical protein